MTSTILIVAENLERAQYCQRLLDGSPFQVLLCNPGTLPEIETMPHVFLLILPECEAILDAMCTRSDIDVHLPFLVLGNDPLPPDTLRAGAPRLPRLIDYLGGPLARETLLAKIEFLQKVAKLSGEHASYLRSHESFLDWFSTHDGLTGLYNRHHFNKVLQQQYLQAQEHDSDLAILVLDIDYLNEINRSCGYMYGDFILNEMSARLSRSTRREDICFRFSGGDFVVLMPGVDLEVATRTAEDVRRASTDTPFDHHGSVRKVSLSIGISAIQSHRPGNANELFSMAETALYKAKADGRNRIVTFSALAETEQGKAESSLRALKATIGRLLEKTRRSTIASLQLLVRDLAGPEHRQHIDRVAGYTKLLGEHLGLPPAIIATLQNAIVLNATMRRLMHNDLLSKPGTLSEADLKILRDLPYRISDVLDIFDYFSQERAILLTHSEHFDGKGFPEGLRGDEIPIGARILNIVDSFAAMQEDRPFRRRLSPESVLAELKNEAGKQFDPSLVVKLIHIIEQNGLLALDDTVLSKTREELLASHPHLRT